MQDVDKAGGDEKKTIAIVGGTGDLGSGLAQRWARAGHDVVIGSRDGERAAAKASEFSARAGTPISGAANQDAAAKGEIVVLTVPFASHAATLETIRPFLNGKILVDVTVPLQPPKVRTVQLPEGGSVAKGVQATLGEDVRVVSAFQNVAAAHLADLDHDIDCDVLVCANDQTARKLVVGACRGCRHEGLACGPDRQFRGGRGPDVGFDFHQRQVQDRRCRHPVERAFRRDAET